MVTSQLNSGRLQKEGVGRDSGLGVSAPLQEKESSRREGQGEQKVYCTG